MEIKYTKDIDDAFFEKLKAIAARGGWNWRHMLAVMYSESGVRANAHNDNPKSLPPEKRYNAVGLIQFMPFVLKNLGFSLSAEQKAAGVPIWEAFKKLSATEQLSWVERFYSPWKKFGLDSPVRFYQATFLPNTLATARDPNDSISTKGGFNGFAYEANKVFDRDKNGTIELKELEAAVLNNARGPRWEELLARAGEPTLTGEQPCVLTLGTRAGQQDALKRLGYYTGEVDGIWGPKSQKAILAFQEKNALEVDGIVGPLTKAVLERLLSLQGVASDV
jgi:hypothetical protein